MGAKRTLREGGYPAHSARANVIDGGAGADTLVGGGGADVFAFNTALGGGNIDGIVDFAAGSDRIMLDDAMFGLALGSLARSGRGQGRGRSVATTASSTIPSLACCCSTPTAPAPEPPCSSPPSAPG